MPHWAHYRRIKLRLILLLAGLVPFFALLIFALPAAGGSNTLSYVMASSYLTLVAVTWFQYGSYRCLHCRTSYRGRQLFRNRCPRCGILINQ